MSHPLRRALPVLVLLGLSACGPSAGMDAGPDAVDAGRGDAGVDGGVDAGLPRLPDGGVAPLVIPRQLSDLHLFKAVPIVDGQVQPEDDVIPYEMATPLFSDYALKTRSVRIPEGAATWSRDEVLDFPVGTILTKTFSFPADFREPSKNVRAVETRLLVRQPTGWEAYPYVWNAEQTEATFAPGGRVMDVSFIDADGGAVTTQYLVPSKNQCQECHHVKGEDSEQHLLPIGPKARYLNFETTVKGVKQNQLERFAALGKLTGLPQLSERPKAIDAFDAAHGSLEERARTYLDINCAHCHRPEGTAGETSQLFLDYGNVDRFRLGECKRPGSAGSDVGGEFDIVPGDHTQSILWFRLQTTESGKMMPLIGRALSHQEGAHLVAEWIDSLPPKDCRAP
ncbi:MAG: SO2930 family diheme c-type cytochrome [Myxococcota bacterium]